MDASDQNFKTSYAETNKTVSEILADRKERILRTWERNVLKELPADRHKDRSALRDHIPQFLDQIAEALRVGKIPDDIADGGTKDTAEIIWDVISLGISDTAKEFTEIHLAHERKSNLQLEEDRRVRERFVLTLSHDLRNPLAAIKTSLRLIRKYPEKLEAHDRLLAQIDKNVNRAAQMIDDLWDANRIHAGKRLPLLLASCELNLIVEEVIEELSLQHGQWNDLFNHTAKRFASSSKSLSSSRNAEFFGLESPGDQQMHRGCQLALGLRRHPIFGAAFRFV